MDLVPYHLPPLTILMVMPDSDRSNAIETGLRADSPAFNSYNVLRANTLLAAHEQLDGRTVDLVLLDLSLLGSAGLRAVEELVGMSAQIPVVVFADASQETLAQAAVSAGAQDYLLTMEADARALHRTVRNAIERQRLLQDERASRAAAEQARRARDDIISVVSHDLRAPLNAISLCARGLDDPRADHATLGHTILQAAEWSRRVIRDLLDVAAIDRGQFRIVVRDCDVCTVASNARALFQQEADARHLTLVSDCPHGPVSARIDPDRLQQAIDNLLENAMRATPSGGRISLGVKADETDVVITVSDTGSGMVQASLQGLFQRDIRRGSEDQKTHLGLTVARAIATAHDGSLSAASTEGVGSTFTLRIPRSGPEMAGDHP